MMAHRIDFEKDAGLLVCQMVGLLDEAATQRLAADLKAIIRDIRTHGAPLRFLVDNREGRVVSPAVALALAELLNTTQMPDDRTAIIVSDSFSGMQAKRITTTEHEVFMSESAARTWLTAHSIGMAA